MTYEDHLTNYIGSGKLVALNVSTSDFSKSAESVWGIAYSLYKGPTGSRFIGNPPDKSKEYDNVPDFLIRHNDSLEDLAMFFREAVGTNKVFLVGSGAREWLAPLMYNLKLYSRSWAQLEYVVLDLRDIYISCTNEKPMRFDEKPWELFEQQTVLGKTFGLDRIAHSLDVHLPQIGNTPEHKAKLTMACLKKLLSFKYPEEDSTKTQEQSQNQY